MNFLQIKNETSAAGAIYTFGIISYFLLSLVGGAILSVLHCEGFAKTAVSSLFAAAALGGVSLLSGKVYRTAEGETAAFGKNPTRGGDKKGDKNTPCGGFAGLKEICGYKKFSLVYIIVAALISAGIFAGFGFINSAFTGFLAKLGAKIPQSEITMNGFAEYAILTLSLAVIPALTEESFFRGALAFGFSERNIFAGAALSGLIFALYHCSLTQLLYQFIYGAFLYVLAVKAGSVIPCVIAHFLNNFAVLTITFFNAEVNLYSPFLIVCGLAALAVAAAILFLYGRSARGDKTDGNLKSDREASGEAEKKIGGEASRITEEKADEKNNEKNSGKNDGKSDGKSGARKAKAGDVIKDFLLPFGIIGVLATAATGILSVL